MQSGVTGINAIRIYSPVKQGLDQDPEGTFTRQWVPELADLPDRILQTPWLAETELSYPAPIVDQEVYEKHGSRKRPRSRSAPKKTATKKATTKKVTAKKAVAENVLTERAIAQKTAKTTAKKTENAS